MRIDMNIIDDNNGLVTITLEEYNYLLKRDRLLEDAFDLLYCLKAAFGNVDTILEMDKE